MGVGGTFEGLVPTEASIADEALRRGYYYTSRVPYTYMVTQSSKIGENYEKNKFRYQTWALLISISMVMFFSVLALADHDTENYERQKANIDMANDGIVGYTHDGLIIQRN